MKKHLGLLLLATTLSIQSPGQSIGWNGQEFELTNVKGSVVTLNGEEAIKLERDLASFPFERNNLSGTVDGPFYAKLKNVNFRNGVIEVKLLSRLQNPLPFPAARGFIGIAFHVPENDSAFECIYLRPSNGRAENQLARNHTVQYFSYPKYKFDKLRIENPGVYETYADVGLDEWITFRIEVKDKTARLYINDQKYPSFVVETMKGDLTQGTIGLWVDIGTEGYFKDLTIAAE